MVQQPEDILTRERFDMDIYRLAEALGRQERDILDFSSPVNPLGVSKKVKAELRKHLKYLSQHPDTEAVRLRKRLGQFHGINPEMILCGNGSTELVYLLARVIAPRKVLIPSPTLPVYEQALLKDGRGERRTDIAFFFLEEHNGFQIEPDEFIGILKGNEFLPPPVDNSSSSCNMAFLCNPNNPTGRLLKKEHVLKIADAARDTRCYLIVDESYMDFCPGDSVISEAGKNPYLVVLRSMTSFYALAGLRIGFGVFPPSLAERLKRNREPWTVNSLAQRAAVIAIRDKAYRKETFVLMEKEKRFLEKKFRKLGIEYFPSDVNFYLLKTASLDEISSRLRKKGILVKTSSGQRGPEKKYLMVAVKTHKQNSVLIREISSVMKEGKNAENVTGS
ncbi:MAG: aminotransferase class I/II-fold pyridoxal phosphate-dependent enzyme [Nitrospirota bacterium]